MRATHRILLALSLSLLATSPAAAATRGARARPKPTPKPTPSAATGECPTGGCPLRSVGEVVAAAGQVTSCGAPELAKAQAQVLSAIQGAGSRIRIKLPDLSNTAVNAALIAAAGKDIDVQAYVAYPSPADGATVLVAQQLEDSGVDTVVVRKDALPDALLVVDGTVFSWGRSCSVASSADRAAADALASRFLAATAEPGPDAVSPIVPGKVTLLAMPGRVGALLAAIATAGPGVPLDIELYQLQDPAVRAAVIAAAGRGAPVRVMLEPKTVGAADFPLISRELAAAKIPLKPTPPKFDGTRNVDHAKLVIVGNGVCVGTGNLVRSSMAGQEAEEFALRDFWVCDGRPEVVAEAKQLFEADWNRQDTSKMTFRYLTVTPENAKQELLQIINGATRRIWFWNQSLADPDVLSALVTARQQRKVDVRGLLGFQPGVGGAPPKNQADIDALNRAGAAAAFFTRHYLHAKGLLADDELWAGSQNWTSGGLGNNREVGIKENDPAVVSQAAAEFQRDQAQPKP